MKNKILKTAGLGLALVVFLGVFALNFTRINNPSGKVGVSLSAMQAKAQDAEDCENGGARGGWWQSSGTTFWTNRYGQLCTTAEYTFDCYSSGNYVCDASCYDSEVVDNCY
jgi:hypothetical protein